MSRKVRIAPPGTPIWLEAALRDRKTGKIYPSGRFHSMEAAPDGVHRNNVDEGFLDRREKFLTRRQAAHVEDRFIKKYGADVLPQGWSGETTRAFNESDRAKIRRASSGSSDPVVQVRAYTRNGRPVVAYERSKSK